MTTDWTCDEHTRTCERLAEAHVVATTAARLVDQLDRRVRRLEVRVGAWAAGGALAGSVLVAVLTALLRNWIGG